MSHSIASCPEMPSITTPGKIAFTFQIQTLVVFSLTPTKISIEPENDSLVQMIFLFQGARILRLHVNLPGCSCSG